MTEDDLKSVRENMTATLEANRTLTRENAALRAQLVSLCDCPREHHTGCHEFELSVSAAPPEDRGPFCRDCGEPYPAGVGCDCLDPDAEKCTCGTPRKWWEHREGCAKFMPF